MVDRVFGTQVCGRVVMGGWSVRYNNTTPHCGRGVDVWALGILAFEFLCGAPPFAGKVVPRAFGVWTFGISSFAVHSFIYSLACCAPTQTTEETFQNILESKLKFSAAVSSSAQKFITALLNPDAGMRALLKPSLLFFKYYKYRRRGICLLFVCAWTDARVEFPLVQDISWLKKQFASHSWGEMMALREIMLLCSLYFILYFYFISVL